MIDGAKALAMTALDLMCEPALLTNIRDDFQATAEMSRASLAKSREPVSHLHAHGACGCA